MYSAFKIFFRGDFVFRLFFVKGYVLSGEIANKISDCYYFLWKELVSTKSNLQVSINKQRLIIYGYLHFSNYHLVIAIYYNFFLDSSVLDGITYELLINGIYRFIDLHAFSFVRALSYYNYFLLITKI